VQATTSKILTKNIHYQINTYNISSAHKTTDVSWSYYYQTVMASWDKPVL